MNCDAIAPFYVWFERLAFGGRLQRHRIAFLSEAEGASRALVLGDGDGRFVAALSAAHPDLAIDCIELSAGMLAQARHGLSEAQRARISFIQADALTAAFPGDSYDVIYTHFFLDCFELKQISELALRIARVTRARARWIISDFRQADKGWRRVFGSAWITTMYVFFRLTTRLQQRELVNHMDALHAQGFRLIKERLSMAGLVASECWQLQDRPF